MNFEFNEDQNLLREQTQGFLKENCPTSVVRSVLDGEADYDKELWNKIVEMGYTATVIPENYGGLGLSYLELSVIAEELGRVVAPVPFSSSVYLATEAILLAGSEEQKEEWLPKLAQGEVIGTFALSEGPGSPTLSSIQTEFKDGEISGNKVPVADGMAADFVVVVANNGLYLVDLNGEGVNRTTIRTVDFSRGHSRVELTAAKAEPLGEPSEGWALAQKILDRAAVLFAWEQSGGSQAALEMAKEYALGRYAFGRSIASYQAIKHKLANMYVKNTLARSNCYYGAWALDTNASELPLAAATARVSASQAYYYASKENIQTHGGMGFTWEFDCQFYFRRAKLLAVNIGSERMWQDRLISAVEESNVA